MTIYVKYSHVFVLKVILLLFFFFHNVVGSDDENCTSGAPTLSECESTSDLREACRVIDNEISERHDEIERLQLRKCEGLLLEN